MNARQRFALLGSFLALALALCTWMTVERIEQELTARIQIALAEADVPFYGVEVDGRDVRLTGLLSSERQARRILEVVSGVEGVRTVEDRTVREGAEDPAERGSGPRGPAGGGAAP